MLCQDKGKRALSSAPTHIQTAQICCFWHSYHLLGEIRGQAETVGWWQGCVG